MLKNFKDWGKRGLLALLWIIFALSIIEQFSALSKILNLMLTSGAPLPLQSFLNQFEVLWEIADGFWITILSEGGQDFLFNKFAWGGFNYAFFCLVLINFLSSRSEWKELTEREKRGRRLVLIYSLIMLVTIIYGLNRDKWIPYSEQPSWIINMVHKQQISAGSFLIALLFIYFHGMWADKKGYEGSLKFYNNPKFLSLMFAGMMLDNLASFDWFFEGLGYEEIFLYGQSSFSFDKVYHFFSSMALTIFLLHFIKDRRWVIGIALFGVFFWEVFEISLNPREAYDSFSDMIVNSSAIILTSLLLRKFEWKETIEMNQQNSN